MIVPELLWLGKYCEYLNNSLTYSAPGSMMYQEIVRQAQLGVPHSEIQVELD